TYILKVIIVLFFDTIAAMLLLARLPIKAISIDRIFTRKWASFWTVFLLRKCRSRAVPDLFILPKNTGTAFLLRFRWVIGVFGLRFAVPISIWERQNRIFIGVAFLTGTSPKKLLRFDEQTGSF